MLRNALRGALAFGLSAGLAGYIWTAFEFPFAVLLPAAIGWYVIVRHDFGAGKAWAAAGAGGVTFTGVLIVGMFLAISDGSPVAITGWLASVLAAVVAGAITGFVIAGWRASGPLAAFAAVGMGVAVMVGVVLRELQPVAAQSPGMVQALTFAIAMGLIGAVVGASVGAGVTWVRRFVVDGDAPVRLNRPHAV